MRTAFGLLLAASLYQAAAPPAAPWPPVGVLFLTDGVTRPEVTRKVAPTYTADAMRARIQGFVTLQYVIEPDGSVGPIRVITSLDTVYGLDQNAIAALKQWTFKPGTRNGTPVRVLATAVLSFGSPDLTPPMTLPAGFDAAPPSSATTWTRESVESNGVLIDFAYPNGYERHDPPGSVIGAIDVKSVHSVDVIRPVPLPVEIPFPMPLPELAQFSEAMSRGTPNGLELVAAGQSTIGRTNWLWLELEGSSSRFQTAPPQLTAALLARVDSVHIWAFSTSVGVNVVQVMCTAPDLKGATAAERDKALANGRTECSEILKRLSFTAR